MWVCGTGPLPEESVAPGQSLGTLSASHEEMHGFRGDRAWAAPHCVLRDSSLARSGYTDLTRDEYEDTTEVLAAKVKLLAAMVRDASFPLAYTGAGISTASGIPDYATGSAASRAALPERRINPFDAEPSDAHLVLSRLHAAGLLKAWVQQNHDGLPQKAGFPQAAMNEIHGAWWDPSNPVVKMDGQLRTDLFEDLLSLEKRADFCLCVGTSLSGMNADRVAVSPGTRAKRMARTPREGHPGMQPPPQGLVLVNLQRTQHDDIAALRIFAKASVVLNALAVELALPPLDTAMLNSRIEEAVATPTFIPYSPTDGSRLPEDASGRAPEACRGFKLDMQEGTMMRVARGKYAGSAAEVMGRTRDGHFRLGIYLDLCKTGKLSRVPAYLGKWWVLEGKQGHVPMFPLVPLGAEEAH
mmetsp:Transcript_29316/g.60080  ORF Transcript_29316/g.60080 Transcript_29316/m.60080 type:complete len:413 (+) Transcript_29316:410-1648(+)